MTLDEAIQLYTQMAEYHEYVLHSGEFIGGEGKHMKQDIKRCVSENRQLVEWLTELKEAKRLLKAAVEGFRFLGAWMDEYGDCTLDCSECPLHHPGINCRCWDKQAEALALIGKDGETE